MRKQRLGLLVAVTMLLLVLAMPALAAFPGVISDGSGVAVISNVVEEDCTLVITVTVSRGGDYRVDILDDGPSPIWRTTYTVGGAGDFTAEYPITAPPGPAPIGIAILVYSLNPTQLRSVVDLIVYNNGASCRAIIVDRQCSATAVIPRGAVVADLPFGGRAYWAPGKITPEVTLNPGTYWVTKVYTDPFGDVWNQIILACQYLWVPAEWMSPTATFDGPWNGEALPETVESF